MPTQKQPEESRAWLQYAGEDLDAARALLKMKPAMVRQALFHAQQAAEKALKGFLIGNAKPYPLIHDIDRLRARCSELDCTLDQLAMECLPLTPFAGLSRYPGEPEVPDLDWALALLAAAEALVRGVSSRLGITSL
jgi:HEPN domain-containing protein